MLTVWHCREILRLGTEGDCDLIWWSVDTASVMVTHADIVSITLVNDSILGTCPIKYTWTRRWIGPFTWSRWTLTLTSIRIHGVYRVGTVVTSSAKSTTQIDYVSLKRKWRWRMTFETGDWLDMIALSLFGIINRVGSITRIITRWTHVGQREFDIVTVDTWWDTGPTWSLKTVEPCDTAQDGTAGDGCWTYRTSPLI